MQRRAPSRVPVYGAESFDPENCEVEQARTAESQRPHRGSFLRSVQLNKPQKTQPREQLADPLVATVVLGDSCSEQERDSVPVGAQNPAVSLLLVALWAE